MTREWECYYGAVSFKFLSRLLKLNMIGFDLRSEARFAGVNGRLREALVQCIHGLGVLLG